MSPSSLYIVRAILFSLLAIIVFFLSSFVIPTDLKKVTLHESVVICKEKHVKLDGIIKVQGKLNGEYVEYYNLEALDCDFSYRNYGLIDLVLYGNKIYSIEWRGDYIYRKSRMEMNYEIYSMRFMFALIPLVAAGFNVMFFVYRR